jgi:prepilin-type N-terminal cleavage/methylation domain-containing protein
MRPARRTPAGVTLVELLVGIAILAIVLALGVPSMREWMVSQRVSSVANELVTDLQLARSEAIRRGMATFVRFGGNGAQTCYVVHAGTPGFGESCDCNLPVGATCGSSLSLIELKTVTILRNDGVTMTANQNEKFLVGGQFSSNVTPLSVLVSDGGTKQLVVHTAPFVQRPYVCAPAGSTMPGVRPCS